MDLSTLAVEISVNSMGLPGWMGILSEDQLNFDNISGNMRNWYRRVRRIDDLKYYTFCLGTEVYSVYRQRCSVFCGTAVYEMPKLPPLPRVMLFAALGGSDHSYQMTDLVLECCKNYYNSVYPGQKIRLRRKPIW